MSDTVKTEFTITGGQTSIGQVAVGPSAQIINHAGRRDHHVRRAKGIGVVTIKAAESRAVADAFGLTAKPDEVTGQRFYLGEVDAAGGPVPLVAARTLEQGNRSIMPTLVNLRRAWNPAIFVIVGVGGAIYGKLRIGDVVVADRVFYYDLRRDAADGVHHRGEGWPAPAAITHAMNSFFDDYGEMPHLNSAGGQVRVFSGPIGSGDAVITDAHSQIRTYLRTVNEKVLAVDMESGGLVQFCHEAPPPRPDWLVVRGISDHADHEKNEDQQPSAAYNAAITLQHLIPYLRAGA
jgi:adenosylhomocysteine nucleosidase